MGSSVRSRATRKPWASSAMRSAVRASSRSSATATSTIPANLPANRDIWLRSQLAPCALIGTETADTRPGRSSPITVRTKVAILAGYETPGTAASNIAGQANTSAEPPGFSSDQRCPRGESFHLSSCPRPLSEALVVGCSVDAVDRIGGSQPGLAPIEPAGFGDSQRLRIELLGRLRNAERGP